MYWSSNCPHYKLRDTELRIVSPSIISISLIVYSSTTKRWKNRIHSATKNTHFAFRKFILKKKFKCGVLEALLTFATRWFDVALMLAGLFEKKSIVLHSAKEFRFSLSDLPSTLFELHHIFMPHIHEPYLTCVL